LTIDVDSARDSEASRRVADRVLEERRRDRQNLGLSDRSVRADRAKVDGHELSGGLRRLKPGYAIVAVATISLGVGAATTLFSVANGVLLRPLPFEDSDRLAQLTEIRGGRQGRVPKTAGPFIE
jgi:hypothetical protein